MRRNVKRPWSNVHILYSEENSSFFLLVFRSNSKDYQLSKFRKEVGIIRDGHADRGDR